jgi:NAD(P)H-dependent FMN reductase
VRGGSFYSPQGEVEQKYILKDNYQNFPFSLLLKTPNMYTIISGTNRPNSKTLKVARVYQTILLQKGMESNLLSLEGLNVLERNPAYEKIEEEVIIPTTRFIFVSPEYNGSIPGVLKALFDISDIEKCWWGKHALLTGVSTGRAGNLRGMEHLTGILHYLKMKVHHNKLPISAVNTLLNDHGGIEDARTLEAINIQLDEYLEN